MITLRQPANKEAGSRRSNFLDTFCTLAKYIVYSTAIVRAFPSILDPMHLASWGNIRSSVELLYTGRTVYSFWKIHIQIRTNRQAGSDKCIFIFWQVHMQLLINPYSASNKSICSLWQFHMPLLTNLFAASDKYTYSF